MYFDHGVTGFPGAHLPQENSPPKTLPPNGTGSTTLISISGAFGGSEAPAAGRSDQLRKNTFSVRDLLENYIPGKCKVFII